MADTRFLNILTDKGVISHEDATAIASESASDIELERHLIERGVPEVSILEAKSEIEDVPYKYLSGEKVPLDILRYIPAESAKYYSFIPLAMREGVLEVGMLDPSNIEAREALQFIGSKFNIPFKVFLIVESDFQRIMEEYKTIGSEVSQVLGELETVLFPGEKPQEKLQTVEEEEEKFTESAPVTRIVAVILRHATEGRASDIHIEPTREKLRVRFRVDGVLHTSLILPVKVHDAIVSRIKILTNMQLDEKRKPQDGRFSTRIEGHDIDFRVSTLPTSFGEKVAIRILDTAQGVQTLPELGLAGHNLDVVKKEMAKPYGMILVTGPTGSGKSTTIYAMLQILNQERYNIVSLEDPVEYNIEGVNQSQVRPEIGYSFASGLRSILRQDPDIMMVGEIRDKETAQLAIHAALTGHLVLSTLHTNNALGVIPRLLDMGVDPYLIPPTLILAIGQRLVRALCSDSRREVPLTGKLKEKFLAELERMPDQIKKEFKLPSAVYEAQPSGTCPKGTRGRTGIFEVISMTRELEHIILTNPSVENIEKEARRQGMTTMREDGLLKVMQGTVGLEELAAVTEALYDHDDYE